VILVGGDLSNEGIPDVLKAGINRNAGVMATGPLLK
jgi:hypothetical protein